MMLPLQEILSKYGVRPTGVIQVGSHFCEEHEEFVRCGIERFVYIEPCKEAFEIMGLRIKSENAILINVACGSEEKEMPMYVSHQNQGQSNSLLEPDLHISQHPEIIFDDAEIVKVVTLDSLPIERELYNILIMDCQGYEGEVLLGATKTLEHIDLIITEVNRGQTYSGNKEIGWIDEHLMSKGFVRKETYWPSPNLTWGDAAYVKV